MTKTIYIHIGTPKTGTSYIQEFLRKNSDILKKYGIYYPIDKEKKYVYSRNYVSSSWQHVTLIPSIIGLKVNWLNSNDTYLDGEALDELLNDIYHVEEEKILLSSEVFYDVFTNKALIRNLQNVFNDFHIKIIVYLRRQDKYLLSYFQEGCKGGTFTDFNVENILRVYDDSLKYYSRLKKWADIFGGSNIIVRPFEVSQFINNSLSNDFLSIFGINEFSEFIDIPKINESLTLEQVVFLMEINKYLIDVLRDTDDNSKIIHQKVREKIINNKEILNNGSINELFSVEDRKKILDLYSDENSSVVELFLNGKKDKLFVEGIDIVNNEGNYNILDKNTRFKTYASILEEMVKESINK